MDGGFLVQLLDWAGAVFDITKTWQWDVIQDLRYDMHKWTLPIEMIMSMLLFVTLAGLSRCKVPIRFALMIMIMLYCFCNGRWAAIEFLGGAFIAEVDLIQVGRASKAASVQMSSLAEEHRNENQLDPVGLAPTSADEETVCGSFASTVWTMLCWLQLLIALWICGWPDHDADKGLGIA